MSKLQITLNTVRSELKEGTKTVFVQTSNESEVITEQVYNNYVTSAPFMRRLGGSETLTKNYTSAGYKVCKIVSKNPSRDEKVERTFNFDYV